jgi:hypothetical protein
MVRSWAHALNRQASGSELKTLPLHKAEVGNEIRAIKDNERLKEIIAGF